MTREAYIASYHDLAIEEMKRSGIPASITLAQALLESDDGNSRLATEGKNHFGIKCKSDWTGATIRQDDDEKNECFRKYNTILDSYKDHSDFLSGQVRYEKLFSIPITDYKSWAKGLKEAGYATNPEYATRLIQIIEDNQLTAYDNGTFRAVSTGSVASVTASPVALENIPVHSRSGNRLKPSRTTLSDVAQNPDSYVVIVERKVLKNNRVKYVIAKKGDSFSLIADDLHKSASSLRRYNEVGKQYIIQPGEKIYIAQKRNKPQKEHIYHTVAAGESMRSIAQEYGITTQSIYKNNQITSADAIHVGQRLRLQATKP